MMTRKSVRFTIRKIVRVRGVKFSLPIILGSRLTRVSLMSPISLKLLIQGIISRGRAAMKSMKKVPLST